MLDKKYTQSVRADLLSYAQKRREVIKISGDAQQHSKKAIFALQRDDLAGAKERFDTALSLFSELSSKFKSDKRLFDEGAYRAALEEYVEAVLFGNFISGKIVGKIKGVEVNSDAFVSGLCDVPGELYRYAIKAATARNFELVKKCYAYAEEIIGELIDMDLTGYHRNKFDQAKQALHKLEQVVYEVSIRG
jgi:predicted translin family RNA/ssDNA-binding protein